MKLYECKGCVFFLSISNDFRIKVHCKKRKKEFVVFKEENYQYVTENCPLEEDKMNKYDELRQEVKQLEQKINELEKYTSVEEDVFDIIRNDLRFFLYQYEYTVISFEDLMKRTKDKMKKIFLFTVIRKCLYIFLAM
jgi:hypothetical protein